MSKDQELDYSGSAGFNTDIAGVSIAEGIPPANLNDAMRAMAKLRHDAITRHVLKSVGSYMAVKTDHNQFWRCAGAVTINLTAAATLGDGWMLHVKAIDGDVVIDPSGTELIDAINSVTLTPGYTATIICSGSEFFLLDMSATGNGFALSTTGPATVGSLTASGAVTAGSVTASGAVTASTVTASGQVTSSQNFVSSSGNAILAAQGAAVYLRPNGANSGTGQCYADSAGGWHTAGGVAAGGGISGTSGSFSGGVNATTVLGVQGNSGNVHFWFYGPGFSDRGVIYTDANGGNVNLRTYNGYNFAFDTGGGFTASGGLAIGGHGSIGGNLSIGLITYGGVGYRTRTGINGPFGGNTYNWYWGQTYVDIYIDQTPFRILTVSDYRTKKDVENLSSTWDKVKALRPVKYLPSGYVMPTGVEATELPAGAAKEEARGSTFTTDEGEQWSLVAHEVQEALIHSAAHGEKDMPNGIQTLNLQAIVAALTKALQEAMDRIEVLEAKLA